MFFLIMSDSQRMDNHIIPECYLDTNLMEALIPTNKGYNHQKGCNTVTKVMRERFNDSFAVGILDRDKVPVAYLNDFVKINECNIELYKHKSKHHYLILHPPLEKWIISECRQVGLLMENYGLHSDFKELMKITKISTSKNDSRFKSLFKALKENNAQGIMLLFEWTNYLINNPYNANETILINKGNLS
jgi:hypothetical protein